MSQTYHLVKVNHDGSRSYRMIGQRSAGNNFLFDGKLCPNHSYDFAKLAIISAILKGWEILGGYSVEEFFQDIVDPKYGRLRHGSDIETARDLSQWKNCNEEWF